MSSLLFLFASLTALADPIQNKTPFRAVSFNLYNRPWERASRLETSRQLLTEMRPTLIALQEVAMGWFLPGDPLLIINKDLKINTVRFWHETNWTVFKTGIALFSQYPVLGSEYHEFKAYPFWDTKGFLFARIELPQGVIGVINVHMTSVTGEEAGKINSIKESQFNQLSQFIRPLTEKLPILVMGDFNEDATTERFQKFLKDLNGTHLFQHLPPEKFHNTWSPSYKELCSSSPQGERVDYLVEIPAKNGARIRFLGGEIVVPKKHPHPSDHCPVMADFSLK